MRRDVGLARPLEGGRGMMGDGQADGNARGKGAEEDTLWDEQTCAES